MEFLRELIVLEPWSGLTAGLIAAMALARGLDFLSTWLVTPRLELEANPLMRRTGYVRMALLNLPLLGLPLLHHGLSITFIVTSLLAAGGNLAGGALARGMGEKRQSEAQARAIREMGVGRALAMNTAGGLVIALAGALLMVLGRPVESHSWWGGLGVVMFGVVGLVHFNLAILRLGHRARRSP
ncbi:MAG: hypothetical protein O7A08_14695 [SAR324 cluster bacterium]|nr:hypothetical protein [SAR324 cluster bacterium]MCZ6534197.1 hypothetical protein [SAR324 cluster bacterium]MCZ6556499.1 hypothetical protein [SAR324 cluster bacterium]MCZ6628574.1 hypothetical protein [SAR324 cluster bacterium]MCZ6646334.1 hypothetical protein [SAR324 cluster bacterium]